MDWSEQTLLRIYEAVQQFPWQQPSVGEAWPYAGGLDGDIEAHLQKMVAAFEQSKFTAVEADFNSFGCGYASFVELFCFKKDGSFTRRFLGSGQEMTGIVVYVSRLAPVATWGAERRTRHARGGSSTLLSYDTLDTMPDGDWKAVWEEVQAMLTQHGIELASGSQLNTLLPFLAVLETNLGEPPYRLFDLLFHWYD